MPDLKLKILMVYFYPKKLEMKRILGILLVLVDAVTLITGCSKGKDPQAKEEPSSVKVTSTPKKKDNSGGPTKKESSGKEEVIDLGKSVKLDLVLIPAGKFLMGLQRLR
jgi:hypothetical protein